MGSMSEGEAGASGSLLPPAGAGVIEFACIAKRSGAASGGTPLAGRASLPTETPHAAGVDIGAQQIYVCIPDPDQTQIVRSFGPYTADLHALADRLVENGIRTIPMESAGVYWILLFKVPEQRGIHCCLIRGHLYEQVPD